MQKIYHDHGVITDNKIIVLCVRQFAPPHMIKGSKELKISEQIKLLIKVAAKLSLLNKGIRPYLD